MYTASIISLFVCTYNVRAHTYIAGDPLPCGEIRGWDELAETFGDISRAGGFQGVTRFRKYGMSNMPINLLITNWHTLIRQVLKAAVNLK